MDEFDVKDAITALSRENALLRLQLAEMRKDIDARESVMTQLLAGHREAISLVLSDIASLRNKAGYVDLASVARRKLARMKIGAE